MGYVYLIHFEQPFHHAQHYIGWTESDVEERFKRHFQSGGSKLLRAVKAAGIEFRIVRVWENVDRNFERQLKNRKKAKDLCPCCKHHPYNPKPKEVSHAVETSGSAPLAE